MQDTMLQDNIPKGKILPTNISSFNIFSKKEFAFIGISPFNSYFSSEKIQEIIQLVIEEKFKDFAIFIPDQISYFTLKALGYDDSRIRHKIRKQENYLRNKAVKALERLNFQNAENKIINLSTLTNRLDYLTQYNLCLEMFDNNLEFKNGCLETSYWVLSSYENNHGFTIDEHKKEVAVQYFLKELPIFLCAATILNVSSCSFIYNSIPRFLKEIYDSYDLVSKSQGFVVVEI